MLCSVLDFVRTRLSVVLSLTNIPMCDCLENLKKLFNDTNSDEFAGFRQLVVGLPTDQLEAMDRKVHSFISSSISQLDKTLNDGQMVLYYFLPPSVHSKLPKLLPGFSWRCLHSMKHPLVETSFFWSMMRQSTCLSSNSLLQSGALGSFLVCRAHPT
jgi:hypothetical protein